MLIKQEIFKMQVWYQLLQNMSCVPKLESSRYNHKTDIYITAGPTYEVFSFLGLKCKINILSKHWIPVFPIIQLLVLINHGLKQIPPIFQ